MTLPNIFDDMEFSYSTFDEDDDRLWHEMVQSWIISLDDLRLLSDDDIYTMAFQPLPVGLSDDEFIIWTRRGNLAGFEYGRRLGWWDEYTEEGPLPPAKRILASDYEGKTMAHVMADVGFFTSIGQARKNGWNRPVEIGIYKVGKTKVIKVV